MLMEDQDLLSESTTEEMLALIDRKIHSAELYLGHFGDSGKDQIASDLHVLRSIRQRLEAGEAARERIAWFEKRCAWYLKELDAARPPAESAESLAYEREFEIRREVDVYPEEYRGGAREFLLGLLDTERARATRAERATKHLSARLSAAETRVRELTPSANAWDWLKHHLYYGGVGVELAGHPGKHITVKPPEVERLADEHFKAHPEQRPPLAAPSPIVDPEERQK